MKGFVLLLSKHFWPVRWLWLLLLSEGLDFLGEFQSVHYGIRWDLFLLLWRSVLRNSIWYLFL